MSQPMEIDLPGELTTEEAAELTGDELAESTTGPTENMVINPITGAVVFLDDLDSLILACDEAKQQMSELKAFDQMLRETAASKTEGTAKTRRLKGANHQAKVVMGDRYPDQSILKEAWNAYPQFRDDYMSLSSVRVKKREVAKMTSMTTDDPAFGQFKQMVQRADESGSSGMPSVSMEK